jgi:large subunit ribosomal protein L31
MKPSLHPTYFAEAQVVCSCGNIFTTGSTKENIVTEVCYKCHPLYTGEKRFMDTKGQIGKFQERQKFAANYKGTKKDKKKSDAPRPQSLRDLLSKV